MSRQHADVISKKILCFGIGVGFNVSIPSLYPTCFRFGSYDEHENGRVAKVMECN